MYVKLRENLKFLILLNVLISINLILILQICKTHYKNQMVRLQISIVLLLTPLFFFFDGQIFNTYFTYGQWIANIIMCFFFAWFYWIGDQKLRYRLIIMVIITSFAEILMSLGIKLYQYRLNNIPIYVPLGHAVVFATVYYLQKQAIIRRHSRMMILMLYGCITLVSSLSLIFFDDVFGFGCFLLFLLFLHYKRSKLFYLLMFMMVLYLELCGTTLQDWAWYGAIGNHPNFPHVANPPVGIAGLYMIMDMLANSGYFWLSRYLKLFQTVRSGVRVFQNA